MRYSFAALALVAVACAETIEIGVGEDGIVFSPNSTTANVGDVLQFRFYQGFGAPHSIVSGAFNSPCKPDGVIYSGYIIGASDSDDDDSSAQVFNVPVTSTDPIWYYCSAQQHCRLGMVGVVNPPSGTEIAAYASAAATVAVASAPSSVVGGAVVTGTAVASGVSSSASSSVTSSASSVSSATSSSSSNAASSSTSSGFAVPTAQAQAGLAVVAGGLLALLA